jgi:uncharacterized protein (DUF362 family)
MQRVFIASVEQGYDDPIREAFEWLASGEGLTPSHRITIKPNLTFPTFRKGVMTNPEALEALIRFLKNFTDRITICESDSGGYNRFSMNEVFRATGIDEMARRYGVRIVNLSHEASHSIAVPGRRKRISVPLPTLILDETDLFITMPVPKIHMNTGVSLSLKNQWGVIQDPSTRLRLHPMFNEVIYAVVKSLPRSISIVDGKYGLTRSGPLQGDVVELNWLLASDNMFAADFVCCHLLGIDPLGISHLRYAFKKESIHDWNDVAMNCDPAPFITAEKFYLRRAWMDYPGLLAFRSPLMAYVAYRSPFAGVLHWLLYRFREPFYDYESSGKA